MSIVKEGFVQYLGRGTYYRIVSPRCIRKPPLVLIHGGPGSTHNYFEVLDPLADIDGREIVSYDQIGCGNSYIDGRPDLWKMETWTGELECVLKSLGIGEAVMLGQSWGGMILLDFFLNCRSTSPAKILGLVLSSTLPSSSLWAAEQKRLIGMLPDGMRKAIEEAERTHDYSGESYKDAEETYMLRHAGGPYGPDDPECLRRPKLAGTESYLCAWGPSEFSPRGTLRDFDVTDRLGEIDVPALIISGGNDLCTPYIAKTMHDLIKGSRWELFRSSRHMCFAEDTDRYIRVFTEWANENGI